MVSEFLRVLALYYACDGAAALRPLSAADVADCMAHYGAVKSHFAQDGATDLTAYLRFKHWEIENADTVAQLRSRSARDS